MSVCMHDIKIEGTIFSQSEKWIETNMSVCMHDIKIKGAIVG